MNISKQEQRALHALAQGGVILIEKEARKIIAAHCVNREGWYLTGFSVEVFTRLKKRKFIISRSGKPYRITQYGLSCVRAQLDNR